MDRGRIDVVFFPGKPIVYESAGRTRVVVIVVRFCLPLDRTNYNAKATP